MQSKIRLSLVLGVFLSSLFFVTLAKAYWIWSPTEEKPVTEKQITKKQTSVKPASSSSLGARIAQGAGWFWSPTQGRFVSPEAAAPTQKTAEEQFQYALKLREAGKKEGEVIRELRKLVRQYPDSAYAPEAQYLIAALFEEKNNPIRAAAEFQKLIHEFPRSERIDEAFERLFKIGNFFLTGEKQKVMGVAVIPVLSKAVEVFRFIVEEAPYGPYGDQAQLRLGIAYRKMGNFEEAVQALETLIANYPTSSLIDEAHYQLAETSYELSQAANSDQRLLSQASLHLKEFIQQYGTSSLAERARILKQQLDEQDAEKNYRIGLYYEKEGFIESAMIYYEDAASRYSQTPFGQKAAERLRAVNQPALTMAKGRDAIEQRLAEVRSMLQALSEEERQKGLEANKISEMGALRGQLETELATLVLAEKGFKEEAHEKFLTRREAFRDREKNLRGKFKIFEQRKKSLRQNQSPELAEVFQKWSESLLKEQDELTRQRKTLGLVALELKEKKMFPAGWTIPFFGRPRIPSEERLVLFEEKKWLKLEQTRAQLTEKRLIHEKELSELVAQIEQLDQKEFEMIKATPRFQELLAVSDLKGRKEALEQKRVQRESLIQLFEEAKEEYRANYGGDFLEPLVLDSDIKKLEFVNGLIASGSNLEKALEDLENQKASLSEAWLEQKEKVSTMAHAFGRKQEGESQQIGETVPSFASLSNEEQVQAARLLKKRIKHLEREIRSRVDQIQDWERENAKRMEQLDELLHPKDQTFKMEQAMRKTLAPAAGIYKLGKAFLFGLPHRDRELIEEAKEKVKGSGGELSSEELKAIRELEEEIELQSILIQGRAKEISEFQQRLSGLQRQSREIPGFAYQSLLVERIPSDLDYSLTNARELLGEENQEAIFVDRINRQTRELEHLERSLEEVNQKIEAVGKAIEHTKRSRSEAARVLPAIPGDAETLPSASNQPSEEAGSLQGGEAKTQLESKLLEMKSDIDQAESEYQKGMGEFEKALFEWYQTQARQDLAPIFPLEVKAVWDEKTSLDGKRREIETSLARLAQEEGEVAGSQKEFLDRKLAELEKRLGKLKTPSARYREVLNEEIERTATRRDSLVSEISFLETAKVRK